MPERSWAAGRRVAARPRWERPSIGPAACSSSPTSIPGHPEVFVVGDAAAFLHQGGKLLPVWRRRRCRARRMRRRTSCVESGRAVRAVCLPQSREHGDCRPRLSRRRSPWARFAGLIGWLSWLFLHIVMLIGFRNRVVVLFEWAVAFDLSSAGRAITGSIITESSVSV